MNKMIRDLIVLRVTQRGKAVLRVLQLLHATEVVDIAIDPNYMGFVGKMEFVGEQD